MKIRIFFFAGLQDLTGKRELEYDLLESCTLSDLQQRIFEDFPQMSRAKDRIRIAVNEEYATGDRPLEEGDTVAYIPPVSGGAGT